MLRNMSSSLLEHGAIETTKAKAKALQRYFEPLITEAKKEQTLHRRRSLLRKVAKDGDVGKLFEVAVKMDRQGGYTRVVKTTNNRADNAETARIEIVK